MNFAVDGAAFSTDTVAPFDFAGTSRSRSCGTCAFTAYPFESNLLSLGSHQITATVVLLNGTRHTATSTFTIADTTSHSLMVSTSSSRAAPAPLAGAVLTGRRFIFLGPAADSISGLTTVVFTLDGWPIMADATAPYDAFNTSRGLDTRWLRNGTHRIVAIVQLAGGARVLYTADFRVTN